jgi:hypothetical protein
MSYCAHVVRLLTDTLSCPPLSCSSDWGHSAEVIQKRPCLRRAGVGLSARRPYCLAGFLTRVQGYRAWPVACAEIAAIVRSAATSGGWVCKALASGVRHKRKESAVFHGALGRGRLEPQGRGEAAIP